MVTEDNKGRDITLLPKLIIFILLGAFLGWIVGLVIWFVFTIFSPIQMAPPLIYQVAWAIFGAIGFPFLTK